MMFEVSLRFLYGPYPWLSFAVCSCLGRTGCRLDMPKRCSFPLPPLFSIFPILYKHPIGGHGLLLSGRTGTVWGEPCARVVPGRFPNQGRSCESSKEPQPAGGARNKNCPSDNAGMVRHGEGMWEDEASARLQEGLGCGVYITRWSVRLSLSAR